MKFVDGRPAAWAGIQDDGAMGFMHVLTEYRRHGYAKEVTIDLIQKYREAGRMPFVHIVRTNQASVALAKSMGFELLKEIYWLEVEGNE
jgi:8-oxo-dGTP diphosphatase